MQCKASTTTKFPGKMSAAAPVDIGTRGTVGSLVMKEIEHFNRHEKPQGQTLNQNRSSFWFIIMTWKKKKQRGNKCLPRICSVVEVAESSRPNGIHGFNYKILKNELTHMQV